MGKIIVIEGVNDSGKETQSKLLAKALKQEGYKVVEFSFPMYKSPTGKIFKNCVLGKDGSGYFPEGYENLNPYVVCLYTAADRKYHKEKIEKYLQDGYIVILNRYTSSNMAHQGSRYNDSEERFFMYQWIDKLEYWLLKLPKPDCTILLKVPAKYLNQLDEKQVSFTFQENIFDQDSVLKAYIELSELYNWDTIDCVANDKMKSVEEIHQEIMKIVRINLEN
ncbi:thymidylate kinase [bacterium]|nr:thymidylate kinase [bacterium]